MIEKVGFVVLGQASADDIVPELSKGLPDQVQLLARGALDGLTEQEITDLQPGTTDHLLVCKVEPSVEAQVAFDRVLPLVQACVYELESEGAELITVLCGANWTELESNKLLINPGSILPQLAVSLSRGKKLGVVLPTILQVEKAKRNYRNWGAPDAVATYITLYDGNDQTAEIIRAADYLVKEDVGLVWMPCMGMNGALRAALQQQVHCPVLLAQSMLTNILRELVGQPEGIIA